MCKTTVKTLLLWAFLGATPLGAQVSVAPVFSSHMILQRDRPIPIWGAAEPRAEVIVTLGDERVITEANLDGAWQVELRARPASTTPLAIQIESGGGELELDDLLLGDLWICAGQSNMEFALANASEGQAALAEPELPGLRLFDARFTATGAGGAFDESTIDGLTANEFMSGRWSRASRESLTSFSAVAFYFGRSLNDRLGVPIGLIDLAAGGTPTEAWIPKSTLAEQEATRALVAPGNWLGNELLGEWCRERAFQNLARASATGQAIPSDDCGPNHAFKPSFMWRTAVQPFTQLPVRGVIWYQGESNAETNARVAQHEVLFPMLVESWRQNWRQPVLPFLYVQLPAMGRGVWPLFRESQRQLADRLDHVGMAVTIDVGHPTDVHPRIKRPVGERLAKLAAHVVYGDPKTSSGPTVLSGHRTDEKVRIQFENTAGGLRTSDGGPVQGFVLITERCGMPTPVPGRIEGDAVVLEVPVGAAPCDVFYAVAPVPRCNLVDADGLPASPFILDLD